MRKSVSIIDVFTIQISFIGGKYLHRKCSQFLSRWRIPPVSSALRTATVSGLVALPFRLGVRSGCQNAGFVA